MTALQYGQDVAQLGGKYAAVAARIPPSSTVLDIGCYTGGLAASLMRQGHRVVGLEQDPEAARIAQSIGVEVLTGSVEDPALLTELQDVRPDVVLLLDVLEHLCDPAHVLRGLHSIVRPGGHLLVTGPNVAYWSLRKSLLLGKWDYGDAGLMDRTHLRFFTKSTWIALISEAGYRVIAFEPLDALIPLQMKFQRHARVGTWFSALAAHVARRWPTLFALTFLIEAVAGDA